MLDNVLLLSNNLCVKENVPFLEENAKLYNRLPVLRAERSLSRQELANAVGVNVQTIGFIERGDYSPSLQLAFRFSELFGLPIEMIFSRQPMKPLSLAHARRNGESS